MSHKIIIPDKDTLQRLYQQSSSTISSVARHFNTSNPTVRKWLDGYKILHKTHKEACVIANNKHRLTMKPDNVTLDNLYTTMSIDELELRFNVGQDTIYQWLTEYNISLKGLSAACKLGNDKEFLARIPTEDLLRKSYENSSFNCSILQRELCVSPGLLRKWFKYYGIQTVIPWRSRSEQSLGEYCMSLAPEDDWSYNNRTLISPYELDIVNHTKRIAVDYGGLYWHSEWKGKKSPEYHAKKCRLSKSVGYDLITIFESDDNSLVEAFLSYKFNVASFRLSARCLTVRRDDNLARDLNKTYHRMGNHGASVHLVLVDDLGIAHQSMTFGKSRYNAKYEWELIRMTTASNTVVRGGASKLFKHFINTYNPQSIITYADMRFSEGSVYPTIGFTFLRYTEPNYWYFHPQDLRLQSRVKYQKHKLSGLLSNFDEMKTEWDNMKLNGFDRIWDCGQASYGWKAK